MSKLFIILFRFPELCLPLIRCSCQISAVQTSSVSQTYLKNPSGYSSYQETEIFVTMKEPLTNSVHREWSLAASAGKRNTEFSQFHDQILLGCLISQHQGSFPVGRPLSFSHVYLLIPPVHEFQDSSSSSREDRWLGHAM